MAEATKSPLFWLMIGMNPFTLAIIIGIAVGIKQENSQRDKIEKQKKERRVFSKYKNPKTILLELEGGTK